MARERMVTRTIVSHEVSFKGYNLETQKVEDMTVAFGVDTVIKNDLKGLTIINDRMAKEGKGVTAVMINSITDKETLYGMTEVEFLKYAKELPPRTKDDNE